MLSTCMYVVFLSMCKMMQPFSSAALWPLNYASKPGHYVDNLLTQSPALSCVSTAPDHKNTAFEIPGLGEVPLTWIE